MSRSCVSVAVSVAWCSLFSHRRAPRTPTGDPSAREAHATLVPRAAAVFDIAGEPDRAISATRDSVDKRHGVAREAPKRDAELIGFSGACRHQLLALGLCHFRMQDHDMNLNTR